MTQKTLTTIGRRGQRVRVFVEGKLVRVQWREGRRRTESWPDTRDNRVRARSRAEGIAERLSRGDVATVDAITLADLWRRYVTAEAPAWRAATLTNATNHWKLFTARVGDGLDARTITAEVMDEVQDALRKRITHHGHSRSPVQVARCLNVVRQVMAWGAGRGLVRAQLALWKPKLAKDEKPMAPGEYRPAEVAAILAALDRRHGNYWRAWVALTLAAIMGRRQRAILHLQWADIDFAARTVRWRAETDKRGRDAVMPLPRDAIRALRLARVWVAKTRPGSVWVIPCAWARRGDAPWSYQALNAALRKAEQRAGVPHRPFRALHGFRRSVVKSIHAATHDLEMAGEFVGDRDVRTLRRSYLESRPEDMTAAATAAEQAVTSMKRRPV